MKEYLLLLRAGKPTSEKTEAERNEEMEAWGVYMGSLSQNGSLIGGLPLVSGGKTVFSKEITAEAVTSAKEGIVGGYLIIKAESLDDASLIAKACPHVMYEGNIEVREIAPMPAM